MVGLSIRSKPSQSVFPLMANVNITCYNEKFFDTYHYLLSKHTLFRQYYVLSTIYSL